MAAASSASVASNDAENRIVGMMVGSAVADAVGIYTNGLAKEKINQAYGRRRRIIASYKANELTHHFPDKHRAQYEDGNWSEATEMALCTLFSHLNDEDPKQLPKRLRHLSHVGNRAYGLSPLDLGQPIKDIVEDKEFLDKPLDVALNRWVQSGGGKTDMNGSNASLVRLHPLAAFAAQENLNWGLFWANDNCRKTHVDSRCSISVLIAIALLRALIRREVQTEKQINPLIQRCKQFMDYWEENSKHNGKEVPANLKGAYYSLPSESWTELSRLLTIQSPDDLQLDTAEEGDVWKCLSLGIFCLRGTMAVLESRSGQEREDARKTVFENIINNIVLQGGAAQANAAFAGALLGAYLGYDAIPKQFRKGLSHKKFLMRKCKLLCEWVNVIPGEGGQKKRKERDSKLGRGRNASERRAMESPTKDRRDARLRLLKKRWGERRSILAERQKTVHDSLKFPPKEK